MSYLDYMSQGMQSAYGGGYSQLHRKPQYTQIGQTKMTQPTRIGLDNMYGQAPQALPELGQAPTFTMQPGAGTITQGQYGTGYEEYLETSPDWEKIRVEEADRWMPTNPVEGQIYDDPSEKRWVFAGGEWKSEITHGGRTLEEEYTNWMAETDEKFRDISLEDFMIYRLYMVDYGLDEWSKEDILQTLQMRGITAEAMLSRLDIIDQWLRDKAGWSEELLAAQRAKAEGHITGIEGYSVTEDWNVGFQDLLDQINAGDIDYLTDEGMLDTTTLREQGAMGNWLADMLEESYKTGDIAGDFYDEEGNLAPEFQTMMDWFGEMDETTRKQYEDYNRAMARHSIQSGHSINSGYYSEAFANSVATRGMQVSEQFATQMMSEMEDQYNYIAKSMEKLLKDMGKDEEAIAFADKIKTERDAVIEEMRQQAELLAAQIGETEAARRGQIISSIVTGIIMAFMAFL